MKKKSIVVNGGEFKISYYPNNYKIEIFNELNETIIVEFISNVLNEREIYELFEVYEEKIVELIKSDIDLLTGFYSHFDIDFKLKGNSILVFSNDECKQENKIVYSKSINTVLKESSFNYRNSLTDEQLDLAFGITL